MTRGLVSGQIEQYRGPKIVRHGVFGSSWQRKFQGGSPKTGARECRAPRRKEGRAPENQLQARTAKL